MINNTTIGKQMHNAKEKKLGKRLVGLDFHYTPDRNWLYGLHFYFSFSHLLKLFWNIQAHPLSDQLEMYSFRVSFPLLNTPLRKGVKKHQSQTQ